MKGSEEGGGRILVVEDEASLVAGLEFNLQAEGYEVVCAADGRAALARCAEGAFDLVVLDIMLPYIDGFQVAETLRKVSPQLPILMLTARSELADRVRGLETGADDYLTKPFHLAELLARIKGMLRRKRWYSEVLSGQTLFRFSDITIDFAALTCRAGERESRLTPQEAFLLHYLLDNRERIISRKELLEKVWHVSGTLETRTVDAFIMRLRKHLESDPQKPVHIVSVRGAGYRFTG